MIVLRRAVAADAAALTELMHASSAYRGDYARILEGYAVMPEQIERDLVVVAAGDAILGFYSLVLGDAPELDLMFVADRAQGRGLGRRLFDHMRDEARRRGLAAVTIVAHPPALPFYEQMGARRVGTKLPAGDRVTWERPILTLVLA